MNVNVRLARKAIDAYNNKDVEAFLDMFAEGADVMFPNLFAPNREELRAYLHEIIKAVPDRRFDITRILATQKTAIIECTIKGKHTGTGKLMGIPPSNRNVALPFVHIFDFKDDKIVRWSAYANYQMLIHQLKGE